MGKIFYSAEETAAKLNVPVNKLKELVDGNKLREFRDGNRIVFKMDQVDQLASQSGGGGGGGDGGDGGGGEGPIELAPMTASDIPSPPAGKPAPGDSSGDTKTALSAGSGSLGTAVPGGSATGGSAIGSAAAGGSGTGSKASASGMRVFEEYELRATDTSAQTQISQPLDEAVLPSGPDTAMSSGSGLLDLTRESDNTSLGAELLEEIYPGDQSGSSRIGMGAGASGIFDQTTLPATEPAVASVAMEAAPVAQVAAAGISPIVEMPDPMAGLFGGAALAAILIMGLTLLVALTAIEGFTPKWVPSLATNLWLFVGLLAALSAMIAFVGFFAGKAGSR